MYEHQSVAMLVRVGQAITMRQVSFRAWYQQA